MEEADGTNEKRPRVTGTGWLPAAEDPGERPDWTDGRCFPAVWRDVLHFVAGGVMAAGASEWRHMWLEDGWDARPEPDTDADVGQAIAAKLHIGLRLPTVLAAARHVWVDPALVAGLPEWPDDSVPWTYGLGVEIPASPLFLDFEGDDGEPVSWAEPTWPLEFHLRGALCWAADGVWSLVPIGSVGGRNPFGGTDYQPWARVVFAPGDGPYPNPGPGDVVVRGDDMMDTWVDMDGESLCAHRISIALNLAARVLRVLWLIEATDAELVHPTLPRPERRRAARAGRRISDVFEGLPRVVHSDAAQEEDDEVFETPCPIPNTHARLEQAHILWHEALEAYHDEAQFLRKLNPLIESLRTVTMVLQKEIDPLGAEIARWYGKWQQRMGKDSKMKWVKERRNEVVHEGDIQKHSRARMSIVGPHIIGQPVEMDVDPSTTAHDMVRRVQLGGLDRRVREDGLLVIERRWAVEPFEDDELLDILAHCFGVLLQIVSEAHAQLGGDMASCEANEDALHVIDLELAARAGRPACMWAGREARTSRRDLESGAPTGLRIRESRIDAATIDDVLERYGAPDSGLPAAGATPHAIAATLHRHARRVFAIDGHHESIAWLLRDGRVIDQMGINAGSRSERYMMFERTGDEAARMDADAVIITGEMWHAVALPPTDPRAEQRATEREDRGEGLVTQLVLRDGSVEAWTSEIRRDSGSVSLEDAEHETAQIAPVFAPLIRAWTGKS
ncbi:MAG: hypothetical protein JWR63_4410 [Conexibacter sp.]|nr:hypothetical protein [Conexibacter sp.]